MEPLFILDQGRYLPTDWARGPWDPRHLHGGPTATLLTHALMSQCSDPDFLLTRVTIDMFRPVPQAPLSVRCEVVRQSKRILLVDAFIADGAAVVARASGLMLRRMAGTSTVTDGAAHYAEAQAHGPAAQSSSHSSPHAPPHAPSPPASHEVHGRMVPSWQSLKSQILDARNEGPLFHLGTEFRPAGSLHAGQPLAVWIHTPYLLLPGQPLSAFERVAAAADYVNAVGVMADPARRSFINADITLQLYREPVGEWMCLESVARPTRASVGISNVRLYDDEGLLGSISASCLENSKPLLITQRQKER